MSDHQYSSSSHRAFWPKFHADQATGSACKHLSWQIMCCFPLQKLARPSTTLAVLPTSPGTEPRNMTAQLDQIARNIELWEAKLALADAAAPSTRPERSESEHSDQKSSDVTLHELIQCTGRLTIFREKHTWLLCRLSTVSSTVDLQFLMRWTEEDDSILYDNIVLGYTLAQCADDLRRTVMAAASRVEKKQCDCREPLLPLTRNYVRWTALCSGGWVTVRQLLDALAADKAARAASRQNCDTKQS